MGLDFFKLYHVRFFSAVFAGIHNGAEWNGFRSILIWTSFAWLLGRTKN